VDLLGGETLGRRDGVAGRDERPRLGGDHADLDHIFGPGGLSIQAAKRRGEQRCAQNPAFHSSGPPEKLLSLVRSSYRRMTSLKRGFGLLARPDWRDIARGLSADGAGVKTEARMRTRRFDGTDRQVSEIGFGSWAIGASWGPVDDRDALAALNEAL